MPRPGLSACPERSRRAASALAALALSALGGGCSLRTCQETEATLEPLAQPLLERRRAGVGSLYYGSWEYRGQVLQLDVYAVSVGPSAPYADEHWRGSAPRLLVRRASEPEPASLELAAPGWTGAELREHCGREVLVSIYVPERPIPPSPGAPLRAGRLLFICR